MAKPKDQDGDVRTKAHNPPLAANRASVNPQPLPSSLDDHRVQLQQIGHLFCQVANWDHGYLKMRRAADSSDVHLTWTWNLTAAAGSYVYVRVGFWELAYGLELLAQKVLEVDEGKRVPTPDKRNPGRPLG